MLNHLKKIFILLTLFNIKISLSNNVTHVTNNIMVNNKTYGQTTRQPVITMSNNNNNDSITNDHCEQYEEGMYTIN